MKRVFMLLVAFGLAVSLGCQETPEGDPDHQKKPVEVDKTVVEKDKPAASVTLDPDEFGGQ